jgi:hypothetical protein
VALTPSSPPMSTASEGRCRPSDIVEFLSDPPDGSTTRQSRGPAPRSRRRNVSGTMATGVLRQTCAGCGRSIEAAIGGVVTRECGCRAGARPRAARSSNETILRHWTTDLQALRGATRMAPSGGDWGLADSRRLNLLGSRLRSLTGAVVAP